MASVNKAILIGNLGSDPELRSLPSGAPVANFNIATTEKWTGKDGSPAEKTEWHKIVVFGKSAENCQKYLKKGRQVYIEGRIQTKEWEKDGVKRYTTEIVANQVTFLGSAPGRGNAGNFETESDVSGPTAAGSPPSPLGSSDDDIPF